MVWVRKGDGDGFADGSAGRGVVVYSALQQLGPCDEAPDAVEGKSSGENWSGEYRGIFRIIFIFGLKSPFGEVGPGLVCELPSMPHLLGFVLQSWLNWRG
jgi:hypothetical protein